MGAFAEGWGPPEGTHRWTEEGTSVLLLPDWSADKNARVVLRVSNPSPTAKRLVAAAGRSSAAVVLRPGEEAAVELAIGRAERLLLTSEAGGRGGDGRGVAVHDVELLEAAPPFDVDVLKAGVAPLLKAVGRPIWRKLPEDVRHRLRTLRPR
jgi:hypothetical protein